MKLKLIVGAVALATASTFIVGAGVEAAPAPTLASVGKKVADHRLLDHADQATFTAAVRTYAPTTSDSVLRKAYRDYRHGNERLLLSFTVRTRQHQTHRRLTDAEAAALGAPVGVPPGPSIRATSADQRAPDYGHVRLASGGPQPCPMPDNWHQWRNSVSSYNVTGTRFLTAGLVKSWGVNCEYVDWAQSYSTHDVTSAGGFAGWQWNSDYVRQDYFYSWHGWAHGGHRSRVDEEFKQCVYLIGCFNSAQFWITTDASGDGGVVIANSALKPTLFYLQRNEPGNVS